MKKLIHSYLNQHYSIRKNHLCTSVGIKTNYELVRDLSQVFALNRKQLKWYIKSWILCKSKSFNFNKFWRPYFIGFDSIRLPIIRQQFATTIASDLVTVQPMQAPSIIFNDLIFNDLIYDGGQIIGVSSRASGRIDDNNIVVQETEDIATSFLEAMDTRIASRAETIAKWKATGFLDGLH